MFNSFIKGVAFVVMLQFSIIVQYKYNGLHFLYHLDYISSFQIILHPNYNFPDNDIAIIKLDRSAILSSFVRPICLPNGEEPHVGDICYATGYGQLCKCRSI